MDYKMPSAYLKERNGWFYYYRRVPRKVSHLDKRPFISLALDTQDEKEAEDLAKIHNTKMDEFWNALVRSGNAHGVEEKFKAAVDLAKSYGFVYKTAKELASKGSREDILRRVEMVQNKPTAIALLGGAEVPKIYLTTCRDKYFDIAVDRSAGKSERWKTKWKNDRTRAMNCMIDATGNKAIDELTRADILVLRKWWGDKIAAGWNADTANKQMRYCKEMIEALALDNQIDIDFDVLFAKTRFRVEERSRAPYEASYVQNTLLPGLDSLMEDARLVLYAMADTGARNSEILTRGLDIRLNEKIPFIWIRGDLKTKSSARQIPLVGAALYAFQQRPEGFTRWSNPDSFSNIANDYLKNAGLRPTADHSVYSLRHTFKDRLRDIGAPQEIIDELMGHADDGPKYGRGHLLETKLKWMEKIAFKIQTV